MWTLMQAVRPALGAQRELWPPAAGAPRAVRSRVNPGREQTFFRLGESARVSRAGGERASLAH
jgi:hypothetical protein